MWVKLRVEAGVLGLQHQAMHRNSCWEASLKRSRRGHQRSQRSTDETREIILIPAGGDVDQAYSGVPAMGQGNNPAMASCQSALAWGGDRSTWESMSQSRMSAK